MDTKQRIAVVQASNLRRQAVVAESKARQAEIKRDIEYAEYMIKFAQNFKNNSLTRPEARGGNNA